MTFNPCNISIGELNKNDININIKLKYKNNLYGSEIFVVKSFIIISSLVIIYTLLRKVYSFNIYKALRLYYNKLKVI